MDGARPTSRDVMHALDAYVPPYVRWRLARSPSVDPDPFQDHYIASLVHADISGFTAIAESYAAHGAAGAEHVRDILDLFFSEFGDIVAAHGGHTLAFAGDAATAMWTVDAGGTLADAVKRAIHCSLALRAGLTGRRVREGAPQLDVHLAVTAGDVHAVTVGGVEGRWLPMVYGDAFRQVARVNAHSSQGQILVSPEAWRFAGSEVVGEQLGDGTAVLTGGRAVDFNSANPADTTELPAHTDIRRYVPRAVQARLEEGAVDWVAEYRYGTVAFIRFGGLAADADAASLQRLVEPIQAEVCASGGSINKVLPEAADFVVVGAWGLPLQAHEDNSIRALRTSLRAHASLIALGARATIGLATGRFFMGHAGTRQHREYALLGDVVNVAARLAADPADAIRCDAATRSAARLRIAFEALAPVKLRNRSDPVAIYRPLAEKTALHDRNQLIGRAVEQVQLRHSLDLLESGVGGVIVIEGEAGIGKTRLAADLVSQTQHRPIQSLVGRGESLERATPYHAWRDIFARLLRIDIVGDRDVQRQRVLDLLDTPERRAKVALTNVVLPLDFHETPETSSLLPPARARATRELLVYLFRRAVGRQPTVVVLEDAHWLDSASWALARDLADPDARLLIVVVARPVPIEHVAADWRALRDGERTIRIRLEALSADDALALACLRLDVDSLPTEVAQQVIHTAEGHPFFTEQLVLAMRDKDRVIRVDSGECRVVLPLSRVSFAETVHALVDSRIDGLSLQQQDTLKVAAVIGRRFDLWSLRRTHPGNPDAQELQHQLDTLVELELLRAADGATGRTYAFKHAITQEAVSRWLLPSERRNLNARVAKMLEERHPADLTPVHALLAHHWREAGVTTKALDYLELAARRALKEDANQEALEYLEQALEYGREIDDHDSGVIVRLAVWKRQFAEACWVMGDTRRARQYVGEAMSELHHSVGTPGAELARQLVIRLAQSVLPQRVVLEKDPKRRQRLLETSRVAALSAILHTDPVDHLGALASGFLSHNLAERAGSANVSALAMLAYGAGMLKLRRISRAYFSRMRGEAHAQHDLRSLLFGLLLESMSLFSEGRITESEACIREGLDLARGGNARDRARLLMLQGAIICFSGQMRRGLQAVEEAYELARYGDRAAVERSWSLIILAGAYAQCLPAAEARDAYQDLREKITESLKHDTMADGLTQNPLRVATAAGLDALIHARAGNVDRALTSATEAVQFLTSFRNLVAIHPVTWLLIEGPLESLSLALERADGAPAADAKRIDTLARQFATVLSRFSRLHPVYRPRALLFQGRIDSRCWQRQRAAMTWQRSLAAAKELAAAQSDATGSHFMFDRALALEALGAGNGEDPDAGAQCREALEWFGKCEMPHFQARVESLIDARRSLPTGGTLLKV